MMHAGGHLVQVCDISEGHNIHIVGRKTMYKHLNVTSAREKNEHGCWGDQRVVLE